MCPVQWECAAFAVHTAPKPEQLWGTWGADMVDLRWLIRQGPETADAVIDQAATDADPGAGGGAHGTRAGAARAQAQARLRGIGTIRQVDTRTYENCRIEDQDDGTVLDNAVVSTNGDSASIHVFDVKLGRPFQHDRITSAEMKAAGRDGYLLTGISSQLVETMGVPEDKAMVHLKVLPGKGRG